MLGKLVVPLALIAAVGCGDPADEGVPSCERDQALAGTWYHADDSDGEDYVWEDWVTLDADGNATWERYAPDGGGTTTETGYWCSADGALKVVLDISDGDYRGVMSEERTYAVDGDLLYWGEFATRRSGTGLEGEWRSIMMLDEDWDGAEHCWENETTTLSIEGTGFTLTEDWAEGCDGDDVSETIVYAGSVAADGDSAVLTVEEEDGEALPDGETYVIYSCAVVGSDVMALEFGEEECPAPDDMYQVYTRQ